MGRLIDEDELIKDRVENDPVVIAAKCTPTACDPDKVVAQLEEYREGGTRPSICRKKLHVSGLRLRM